MAGTKTDFKKSLKNKVTFPVLLLKRMLQGRISEGSGEETSRFIENILVYRIFDWTG